MHFRSTVAIATLLVVATTVVFCCFRRMPSQRSVSQAIERCLGMPVEACGIVSNFLLDAESKADLSLDVVYESLKEKKATLNLLAGILFSESDADLDFEHLTTAPFFQAVLDNLTIDSNKTLLLVRPEHVSLVKTHREPDGTIGGSFDWTIDGLMKGRCNFIYEAGVVTYLGIARRNSLGIYDCQHIFYCSDDDVAFPYWKGRAVVLPFRRKHSYDFSDLQNFWNFRVYYAVVHLETIDLPRDSLVKAAATFDQWLVRRGCVTSFWRPKLRLQGLETGYAVVVARKPEDLESAVGALIDEFGATLCGKEIQLMEDDSQAVRLEVLQALVDRHQVKCEPQENSERQKDKR